VKDEIAKTSDQKRITPPKSNDLDAKIAAAFNDRVATREINWLSAIWTITEIAMKLAGAKKI